MQCVSASVLSRSLFNLSCPLFLPSSLSTAGPVVGVFTSPLEEVRVDTSLRERVTLVELFFWSLDLELAFEDCNPTFAAGSTTDKNVMYTYVN